MKSLKSQTIKKLNVLKNKTLVEISDFLEDGKNPAIRDVVFSSRESLRALFEVYMTIHPPDNDEPEAEFIAREDRRELIDLLESREDLQSSSELEQFFVALGKGFMWNYMIVLPYNAEKGDLFTPMPKRGVRNMLYQHVRVLEMEGTLPRDDSMGVMFLLNFISKVDNNEPIWKEFKVLQFWKRERNVLADNAFKTMMYNRILYAIKEFWIGDDESDDQSDIRVSFRLKKRDGNPSDLLYEGELENISELQDSIMIESLVNSHFDFTGPEMHLPHNVWLEIVLDSTEIDIDDFNGPPLLTRNGRTLDVNIKALTFSMQ